MSFCKIVMVIGFFAAFASGCSEDEGIAAECQAIIDLCHPKDTGSGAAHDCHEFAEDLATTADQCSAKKAECDTACK